MDNLDDAGLVTHWATPAPAVAALTVGGVAMGIAAIASGADPAGKLLVSLAAIGLLVAAALGGILRPRLAILGVGTDELRIAVRKASGTQTYGRADVTQARIVRYPRLGRRVPMLELDVQRTDEDEDRLVIFSRWDLGTDPHDVLESLAAHGFVPDC